MATARLFEALGDFLASESSALAVGENLFFAADPDGYTAGSVIRPSGGDGRDLDLEQRDANDHLGAHIREEMIQIRTHGARLDDAKEEADRIYRILDGRRRVTISADFHGLAIDAVAPPDLITVHDEEEEEGDEDEGFVEFIFSTNYRLVVRDDSTLG